MKKTFSVFIAVFFGFLLVVLLGVFAIGREPEKPVFVPPCDVEQSYAKNEILTLCESGVLECASDGERLYFFPEKTVSRADFARALIRFLGVDPEPYRTVSVPMADEPDVTSADLSYVKAAVFLGLIPLYETENGLVFTPGEPITRQEAAYLLSALSDDAASTSKTALFSDFSETDAVFSAAVEKAVACDLLIGYPDGTLRPRGELTREELALMLTRTRKQSTKQK